MSANGSIGFFGKIPAHGDFVRGNAGDPLAQRLVRWLEEATEACHRSKARLSPDPLRFLFRAPGESRSLVGVLRGSQDRVGRQFPLAVFVPVQGPAVEAEFPSAPAVYGRFLDAAAAAIGDDAPSAAALAQKLSALPAPGPGDGQAAAEEVRAQAARPSDEFLRRLFGEAAQGRRHYALNTFLAACGAVRGREPGRAETVLDCPTAEAADVWTWLELARLSLGWGVPPPFFVRSGSPGRLLLSLGAPPAAVLPALCDPPRDHPRIWPLVTSSPAAVDAARKALGKDRCAAVEGGSATLAEFARTIAGGR